jgi:hypothetical protein
MDHPREVTDQLDFKGIIGGEPKRLASLSSRSWSVATFRRYRAARLGWSRTGSSFKAASSFANPAWRASSSSSFA